jgi:hypothetical protein
MKRILVLLMIAGLIAGSVATAEAKKKKKKVSAPVRMEEVVEIAYTGGNIGVATPAATGGSCLVDQTVPFHCLNAVPPFVEASFIKVEVIDSSGQKAGGFLSQGDVDGDTIADGYGDFCGAHPEPVAMNTPGAPVDISLFMGVCSDASGPSIVTTGTIKVTFSNMP